MHPLCRMVVRQAHGVQVVLARGSAASHRGCRCFSSVSNVNDADEEDAEPDFVSVSRRYSDIDWGLGEKAVCTNSVLGATTCRANL